MSSFYTDPRVRESAKKSSPKKTGGKGTGKSTGAGKAPAKVVTSTTKDSTPELVEPAKPSDSSNLGPVYGPSGTYRGPVYDPNPTGPTIPSVRGDVVQPKGREEYLETQKALAAGPWNTTTSSMEVHKAERDPETGRQALLRQAAAQETPLGMTSAPAEPHNRVYSPGAYDLLKQAAVAGLGGDDVQFERPQSYPLPLGDARPEYGEGSATPYAPRRSTPREFGADYTRINAPGGVLAPPEAPPFASSKYKDPSVAKARLLEDAPPKYRGPAAVIDPYMAGVENVSIPVMQRHIAALEAELAKDQSPQRQGELQRDLERAQAIYARQDAYLSALME